MTWINDAQVAEGKKKILRLKAGVLSKKKCPSCGSNALIITKKLTKCRDRVYKCLNFKCNNLVGAPTTWAYCDLRGQIAKDIFINDCLICEHYKAGQKCSHFVEKLKKEEIDERKKEILKK